MLLQLLVHQPRMLGQVVQHTPSWVWGLLAGLLWLGASQLFARTVGLRRVLLMPLAMAGLSVYGLVSAFGGSGHAGAAVLAWLTATAMVTALALWFRPTAPSGTLYAAPSRSFRLPGSAMPLVLILGIFLTKYVVGVELAMQPALAQDGLLALQIAALYGVFSGLFVARALRLLRLARQGTPFAAAAAAASA